MAIKLGINGFGRIGRHVLRVALEKGGIDVVRVNDLTDAKTLAHLFKYDSTQGQFDGTVEVKGDDTIVINGKDLKVSSERDPSKLPWAELGVDVVLESTGFFGSAEGMGKHVEAGAPRVLVSQPAKGEIDGTIVMGVNDDTLDKAWKLVSNASCTTNSLAPPVKVLHDNFKLLGGMMTTVHAYTNDQRTLDLPHTDLRRARTAATNIIPTSTGAARAIGVVIPELKGKLDGMSLRVPIPVGSFTDLTATVEKKTTVEEVNALLKAAADGPLKGIMEYTDDPIVSSDIVHNPHSAIIDGGSTMVLGDLVKIGSWYDNEWGFSNRVIDLIKKWVG